jgi:hypothetical protein
MNIKRLDDLTLYWMILYFLTSLICYFGLDQILNTLANLIFGLTQLFEAPVITVLYGNFVIRIIILLFLAILTIKVLSISNVNLQRKSSELFLRKKTLRMIAIIVSCIYVLNFVTNIAIKDLYESKIQEYYEANLDKLIYGTYFELTQSVYSLLRNGIILTLFFILLGKLPIEKVLKPTMRHK